ncbi:reverse transcriptase domain-containing protein [Tanacetum coccineum]
MSSDSVSSEEPDSPKATPASPDYVSGPKEPEQAPPSPDYVPGYITDSDPEKDSEDGPVDYPADGGDDDDDDESSDNDEDEEEASEEEHLAPTNSVIAPVVPMPFPSEAEVERLLALPTPPSSPLISLSPPSIEECLARCLAAHALPSSPLPIVPHPYGESSTVAARPTRGHKADYGFISTLDADTKCQRAKEVGYGIRDVWVDPVEAVEEVAPTTLEGVNARVTELVEVQKEDTQDIYAVIEDAQDRYDIDFPKYDMARDQTHADDREGAEKSCTMEILCYCKGVAAGKGCCATRAAVLSTNGQGDGSHNSDTGIRGTVRTPESVVQGDFLNYKPLSFKGTKGVVMLSQWFEKIESVFHISNCAVENQVKFATCTFLGNTLIWWNSYMKTVTQDVAYVTDWKALKKMMTVKYCPRGEIKKLEIELWNLKDVPYVGGLPDMIRGNVMSYQPKTMEKAIKFANDQMDQKVLTVAERQAEQKRKLEFNDGNNQGHQQQNKRQNTGRAYTAGPGEKREYTGSLPLCTKCNYHHKGPCAPRCNKCKKIGHLARDCRNSGSNGNNNNRGNSETTQNAGTCYECGVQGNFKRDFLKLKNKNRELGSFDVIVGMHWLAKYHAVIDCAEKIVRIP